MESAKSNGSHAGTGARRLRFPGKGSYCIHKDGSISERDLVVEIRQLKQLLWNRRGNDLYHYRPVDPELALRGFQFNIRKPDGSILPVSALPDKAASPSRRMLWTCVPLSHQGEIKVMRLS